MVHPNFFLSDRNTEGKESACAKGVRGQGESRKLIHIFTFWDEEMNDIPQHSS